MIRSNTGRALFLAGAMALVACDDGAGADEVDGSVEAAPDAARVADAARDAAADGAADGSPDAAVDAGPDASPPDAAPTPDAAADAAPDAAADAAAADAADAAADAACLPACTTDADCADDDPGTAARCAAAATCDARCERTPIACAGDADCADADPNTADTCEAAGTAVAVCRHGACAIACRGPGTCADDDPRTRDTCAAAGTCAAACVHERVACADPAECDDADACTADACDGDTCEYASACPPEGCPFELRRCPDANGRVQPHARSSITDQQVIVQPENDFIYADVVLTIIATHPYLAQPALIQPPPGLTVLGAFEDPALRQCPDAAGDCRASYHLIIEPSGACRLDGDFEMRLRWDCAEGGDCARLDPAVPEHEVRFALASEVDGELCEAPPPVPEGCAASADCDDGDTCTADACTRGACEHDSACPEGGCAFELRQCPDPAGFVRAHVRAAVTRTTVGGGRAELELVLVTTFPYHARVRQLESPAGLRVVSARELEEELRCPDGADCRARYVYELVSDGPGGACELDGDYRAHFAWGCIEGHPCERIAPDEPPPVVAFTLESDVFCE